MKNATRIARTLSLLGLAVPFMALPARAQTDITALGTSALGNNTTGDYNTAMGANALRQNTTGSQNTAHGRGAMYKNVGGENNTAVGMSALYWNSEGDYNVAVGHEALSNNTIGYTNTAVGATAMVTNTEGYFNTAVGQGALQLNTTGFVNVAVGKQALLRNSTGNTNTGVGFAALELNTTGNFNVAMGYGALRNLNPGSFNTAVGYQAASSSCTTCTNIGAFGYNAAPTASNTIRIGNSAITQIGGSVPWSNLSDGRHKTNVKENVPGLAFIQKLKPVTFNWKLDKLNESDGAEALASDPLLGEARESKARKVYTGFIAQDVEAAALQCEFDFSGIVKPENEQSSYQLSYAEFVVPLVKAVQEQQKEITELREIVQTLAAERRMRDDRMGSGALGERPRHAGIVGGSLGAGLTLVGALLVLLHLKRRRAPGRASA